MPQLQVTIEGTVQGVGFRPFVHGLAKKHGIVGSVANQGGQVRIIAGGREKSLARFISALGHSPPPLARITCLSQTPFSGLLPEDFHIRPSTSEASGHSCQLPADMALCLKCLAEVNDPSHRRYNYPFNNCLNCGPRYTITEKLPYDRPRTALASFPLCPTCKVEFQDPLNRRFHAQAMACPQCGPRLCWRQGSRRLTGEGCLTRAMSVINDNGIIALKGLGGYQLACDAHSQSAISHLRQAKNRPDKPLAVMAADLAAAKAYCQIGDLEASWLQGSQRPIMVLKQQRGHGLPPELNPGLKHLGLMLPTTALHHLLFAKKDCPDLLVMTSANGAGEPICLEEREVEKGMARVAAGFLHHDRPILCRVDDSLAQAEEEEGKIRVIRRARGLAPQGIKLNWSLPPLLACGAEQKNTFTLAQGKMAWPSQHIGDLSSPQMLDFYKETIYHLQDILQVEPSLVVSDLHPDYLSSHFARKLGLEHKQVQHHHAHGVAVMAEHDLQDTALAIVLDGAGLGPDGTIWGGEIMRISVSSYQRVASLEPLPLPGGDRAARSPWRPALAALFKAYGSPALQEAANLAKPLATIAPKELQLLSQMLEKKFNSPLTTSCGRLFDAVAALIGCRLEASFEGQAAMELEALAHEATAAPPCFPVQIHNEENLYRLASSAMVRELLAAQKKGLGPEPLALAFHEWLVAGLVKLIASLSQGEAVVLAGGCLQNRILRQSLTAEIKKMGLAVYSGEQIPVNDGGISLGQAVIGGLS
ncbi:MAG: carbamoyltransferase HypF [Thermodesulfobacteriota bacterium]